MKNKSSKTIKPTCVILIAVLILVLLPNRFENPVYSEFTQCRAKVLSVDNSTINRAGLVKYGEQLCSLEILNGKKKGMVVDGMNLLTGSMEIDKIYDINDIALVMLGINKSDEIYKVTMVDHYRINYQIILVSIFMILLIALAGWIGVRAILSFIFTVLCIWKVLIPLLLQGYSAILCGAAITAATTAVIIILVYGFDKRFIAALMGSLLGTGLTAVLAVIFIGLFKIQGTVMNYSESLLYSGYSNLKLTDIFISSIFIASSGALMDIAVDITSAVHEVIEANPNIGRKGAIRAGMNVGRAALGTMTTTLLLAYSGGYIGLLMVFVAQGTPIMHILNLNYISAEVLNTVIGSFGLITVAPFSAVTSGILLTNT